MSDKSALRTRLRADRKAAVASLPAATKALLFKRPPAPLAARIAPGTAIGLYHPLADEAPTSGYVDWFFEIGHVIALPWFADRGAAMAFRRWDNPHDPELLERGPFGIVQPRADAALLIPRAMFVPLLGFTVGGDRIGQGAGHYDRWLAAHPGTLAIGMAWDSQLVDSLPSEPHDIRLDLIVTPTRLYET